MTDHEEWCNKNQGPNGYAVECDCGYDEIMTPDGPVDMLLSETLDTHGDPWGDADT